MEITVKPVLARRNKILAHLDSQMVRDFQAIAAEAKITVEEIDSLYVGSMEVLNDAAEVYRDSETAPEMIGWDDFQGVIELMQKGLQAEEEELKRLMET